MVVNESAALYRNNNCYSINTGETSNASRGFHRALLRAYYVKS